jgi:glycosyltransferase involved in cell wall biosynthesis
MSTPRSDAGHQPLVTAIIPTYNMAVCIGDAIQSVLDQTYPSIEVLVVDDGSTDNTREVVDRYGERVRYLRQENAGQGAARNWAIRESKGTYVAFLDADDQWLPEKIARQVALAIEANVPLVGCGYSVRDMTGTRVFENVIRRNFPDHAEFERVMSICQLFPGSGSGVLAARHCFDEVGFFDVSLRFAQDWDMWLRLVRRYPARFVEDVLLVIRKNNLKPAFRTQTNEQRFVSNVIEKNVTGTMKRRSYAALHARLGSNSLSVKDYRTALKHLLTSIRTWPLRIFPFDFSNRYRFPRVPRYYLALKCVSQLATRSPREATR